MRGGCNRVVAFLSTSTTVGTSAEASEGRIRKPRPENSDYE